MKFEFEIEDIQGTFSINEAKKAVGFNGLTVWYITEAGKLQKVSTHFENNIYYHAKYALLGWWEEYQLPTQEILPEELLELLEDVAV
jgi:hypothetical protein